MASPPSKEDEARPPPSAKGKILNDEQKSRAAATKALDSMRFCTKMCFATLASDLLSTLIDGRVRPKFFGTTGSNLGTLDYVSIFSGLTPLVFGAGLWYTTRTYQNAYDKDFSMRMDADDLLHLFRTKVWIWSMVAVNVMLASVSLAAALPDYDGNGVCDYLLWRRTEPKQLAYTVMGMLVVGGITTAWNCRQTITNELQAYSNNHHGIQQQQQKMSPKMKALRAAATRAYIAQALCANANAMLAVLQLLKWITLLKPTPGIILHVYLGRFSFLNPYAISKLLFALNEAMVRATIAEVMGGGADSTKKEADRKDGIYNDVFVAGAGFYGKIGGAQKGAAIFHLAPYIIVPIVTFVLDLLKKISFIAAAMKSLGI